jgi:hypothetical protein
LSISGGWRRREGFEPEMQAWEDEVERLNVGNVEGWKSEAGDPSTIVERL